MERSEVMIFIKQHNLNNTVLTRTVQCSDLFYLYKMKTNNKRR